MWSQGGCNIQTVPAETDYRHEELQVHFSLKQQVSTNSPEQNAGNLLLSNTHRSFPSARHHFLRGGALRNNKRKEGEGKGRGFLSDVKLVSSQVVHERLNQEVCGEVEDQAEGDGDGQCRQSLLEDGQQQQGQAQALRQVSHR